MYNTKKANKKHEHTMALQTTELSQKLQSFLTIDNELQELAARQKELREQKQILQKSIVELMKQNHLEDRTVKLSGRQFIIVPRKQYSGITFGYLDKTLGELIQDPEQKSYVLQYLKDHREMKEVHEIRVKPTV